MPEIRDRRERQTLSEFIVLVAPWDAGEPVVLGAVSEATYEAKVEEGTWETFRMELVADVAAAMVVPVEELRDVRVSAWLPWLWETPEVSAEEAAMMHGDWLVRREDTGQFYAGVAAGLALWSDLDAAWGFHEKDGASQLVQSGRAGRLPLTVVNRAHVIEKPGLSLDPPDGPPTEPKP